MADLDIPDLDTHRVERWVLIGLVALNLLATTAGGYFLMGRYEVRLFQTSEELSRLQIDLAKVDLSIKNAKENYELAKSTLAVTK